LEGLIEVQIQMARFRQPEIAIAGHKLVIFICFQEDRKREEIMALITWVITNLRLHF